jgi:uncharacterized protein with PIN domain
MEFNNLVKLALSEQQTAQKQTTLDQIQAALDVIGFEPSVGSVADMINTVISSFRAALTKEPNERKKHVINAGISAISLVPFADVLKLLKLRKSKPAIQGAKAIKTYGKTQQNSNRFEVNENNVAGGITSAFGSGVTGTSTVNSGDTYAPGDTRMPKLLYKGVMTRSGMKKYKKKRKK